MSATSFATKGPVEAALLDSGFTRRTGTLRFSGYGGEWFDFTPNATRLITTPRKVRTVAAEPTVRVVVEDEGHYHVYAFDAAGVGVQRWDAAFANAPAAVVLAAVAAALQGV